MTVYQLQKLFGVDWLLNDYISTAEVIWRRLSTQWQYINCRSYLV